MRRFWIIAVLVAGGCETAERVEAPRPAMKLKEPLSPTAIQLTQIDWFALGGVAVGGEMSVGEELARKLASEPNAIAMFDQLATHENRVARLYSYWAFRTLDPGRAERLKPVLEADRTEIHMRSGCRGYPDLTQQAVRYIERREHL